MLAHFAYERNNNYKDLRGILALFNVKNAQEIVQKYQQDQMLRLTAMKLRDLLWDPLMRDELTILINVDRNDTTPYLINFIENITKPAKKSPD